MKSVSKILYGRPKKQAIFIMEMAKTDNILQSSKTANISEPTAHKWIKAGMHDVINEVRVAIIEKNLQELQLLSSKANESLIEILNNKTVPWGVKMQAIKEVNNSNLVLREQNKIIDRLAEVENVMSEGG